MIGRVPRARSGITLIEILVSILIMGVGVISLATLFPIGLMRLHAAQKWSRSTYLGESAAAELNTRNLLGKSSFLNPLYSPWYVTATSQYDPTIQDTASYGGDWPNGAYRGYGGDGATLPNPQGVRPGTGLYFAYDPLWRQLTGLYPNAKVSPTFEARFGSGAGFIRADPGDKNNPSADGLQRLTNFNPQLGQAYQVPNIFVSPEDIVLNDSATQTANSMSTVLPDLTLGGAGYQPYQNDWRFTWIFTGYQCDSFNGTVFDGDIVVFENRPFGTETMNATVAGSQVTMASGERTVEAIFGSSTNVLINPNGNGKAGYAIGADKTVLLRWPAGDPDPEIKVGSWIADVTYTRLWALDDSRRLDAMNAQATDNGNVVIYPYQRCYWYQIAKKTTAGADTLGDVANYRSMSVTVTAPLRAKTLLNANGTPYHVNAALVSPFVANVIARTVYSR